MQQHSDAKAAYPDAVLFFRLGDFYEMFGDDAVLCSQVLDLTLTSRNKGKPDEIPMAGVPHHAAHGYIGRLLGAGHKVAICEQMADPKTTRGIVPRQVVRVFTPGTVTHDDHLDSRENSWLGAIDVHPKGVGLAFFDLSTGELLVGQGDSTATALAELERAQPRELLLGDDSDELAAAVGDALPQTLASRDEPLEDAAASEALGEVAGQLARLPTAARKAAARVLRFARACNPTANVQPLSTTLWEPSDAMIVDGTAQLHLELSSSASGERRHTLLGAIDATETAGGSRLLRQRLLSPLKQVSRIRRRLDQVEAFVIHSGLRTELKQLLKGVTDIERIGARASLGEVTPRELGRLRDGLLAAGKAARLLAGVEDHTLRETLGVDGEIDLLDELAAELDRALVERPPNLSKDGEVFLTGYDSQLDELASLCKRGTHHTVELESRLRSELDLPTLKIRYTRVFGWYVEVSRAHVGRVPKTFRRKQTVASGERYTLDELDELAARIDSAEESRRARELELLEALVGRVRGASGRLSVLAQRVSAWDCAAGLAEVAHRHDYVRPEVDEGDLTEIVDGRHPVVERSAAAGRFVPNDVKLDATGERLWIVTGPNMAGKSTLLRQTALITILAQMGSYVPAREARVGVVDRVLSRVGASDNLARGESTFMVEMRETADILLSATSRSLVILDEIGRGTSTFDGLAIAWAVAEHLAQVTRCRALFATHYHEMTALSDEVSGVENYSVSARELEGEIVFLHRLVPGPASRSYGVAVAKLAGLPPRVLTRAAALLEAFEAEGTHAKTSEAKRCATSSSQLNLFQPAPVPAQRERILNRLLGLDLNRLSPLDALTALAEIQAELRQAGDQ